jgi:DNA-binding MarR family transcriptional regulator
VLNTLEKIIGESGLDPASCVLRHITRSSRLVVASFDAAFRPLGLTGHQFNLLMTLGRSGPMTVNNLAAAIGMHASTTPRLVAPLGRQGLVRSQPGTDRRERLLAITAKGRAKLIRAYPRWAEVQRRIMGQIGDREWSMGKSILKNIRKSLRNLRR